MKYTWDLSPIFAGDNDSKIKEKRILVEKKSGDFIKKWKGRNDYLTDPVALKEALDEYELWSRETGAYHDEVYYFDLRTQQDLSNPTLKASYNQVVDLATKIYNEMQFFTLRVAKIKTSDQSRFLNHPSLKVYRHFLEVLFRDASYQLSEAEESILNLKYQTSHADWVKMISSFIAQEERTVVLEDGNQAVKSFSNIVSLLSNKRKAVRDSAAVAVNDILEKHSLLAEQEMNSIMANKKVDDELRHLPRPDTARHLADDIETEAVDMLLKSVSDKFDISRRWYQLKAKLLDLPKLAYHERMVEYGEINKNYSYEDSCKLVSSVFTKLDPEFGKVFDDFVNNGQIDAYPKKGKRDGAFCASAALTLPTYILLNHTNKLQDVSTLAHEAGHGINNELMRVNQNALNFGTPLSTAEVASTFMEDFVTSEVAKEADDELRLSIMVKKMDDDVASIFRQTACYLFEQEMHREFRQKGYLSKKRIGEIFLKHMEAYMGPGVEQSSGSENWWVYWGHIRSFFYVYSYASGQLISKSLQRAVKEDPRFILKVKQFLSAGTSESPKEIFAKLGVNITQANFWQTGLQEIEDLLNQTEKLALKLGKIL